MEELQNKEIQIEGLTEKEAAEIKVLLSNFIKDYSQKDPKTSDKEWLAQQYKTELPDISAEKAMAMAVETVDSVEEYDKNLKSLNDACTKGKSKEQWFYDKVTEASVGVSVIDFGNYAKGIDTALSNANAQMLRTVTTNAGNISEALNLDGFIAEQHHVNSFNSQAAIAKSKFFAEVKVPEPGETYGKNSFDVVIRDATKTKATPVHQYQVKYGADAKATIQLLKEHGNVTKYSNQQIVVPSEQLEEVRKAFPGKTIVSEIGGTEKVPIKSTPLTKEQAKKMQADVQGKGAVPVTDWNSFTTKELVANIGKNAGLAGVQAAGITTGFALATRLITKEPIDTEEVVETALKTGADVGIKAAVTGALKVGVEKGKIPLMPPGTPCEALSNIVCVSIENIKILSKVVAGELTMSQALDKMGRTSTAMVYGIGWGGSGAMIGAASLSWIPIVGPAVGGLIGGMVGYMAGSKYGEVIYKGVKAVGRGVKNVAKATWNSIKSVGRGVKKLLCID